MKKRSSYYLTASVLAVVSGPALADPSQHPLATTRLLVSACQSEQATLRGMCIGYLGAMVDGIVWLQKDASHKRTACLPQDLDIELFRQALLQYVAKTPAAMDGYSLEALKASLEAQWPCPR